MMARVDVAVLVVVALGLAVMALRSDAGSYCRGLTVLPECAGRGVR